jgi:hypothetical protein
MTIHDRYRVRSRPRAESSDVVRYHRAMRQVIGRRLQDVDVG